MDTKHNEYRFLDKPDEKGKPQHLHQLWSDRSESYENLTGATTIIDVLGKVLTWWASGLAVAKLGWTNSKIKVDGKYQEIPLEKRLEAVSEMHTKVVTSTPEEYLNLLDEAYKAHSVRLDETADAGTDLHAELELFVKNWIAFAQGKEYEIVKYSEKIHPFIEWAEKNVKRFLWSEGYCYDQMLFVGGITDCGAELNDGTFVIIDFKSAKEAYFNHFVQIAIYNLLIEKNGLVDKFGNYQMGLGVQEVPKFTKYIVVPFGAKEFTVSENINVDGLKKAALACIELYRQKSAFENQ